MDAIFDTYSAMLPEVLEWARERYPKDAADSDFVYKQTIKAKACDAVRGVLPAATLSNVGIYGTGQAYEAMLLRMRAHPLPGGAHLRAADAGRAAEGHPVVPRPRRPARSGRRLDGVPARHTATTTGDVVERIFGADDRSADGRGGHARRLGSRR